MAWMALTIKIVLGLVGVLAAVGGIAYASDYGIEATVTHVSGCSNAALPVFGGSGGTPQATVQTRLLAIDHTLDIDRATCSILQPNNYVVYHVRTGHTTLYKDGSKTQCMYDSTTGPGC